MKEQIFTDPTMAIEAVKFAARAAQSGLLLFPIATMAFLILSKIITRFDYELQCIAKFFVFMSIANGLIYIFLHILVRTQPIPV